jgi:hypothetical protein
LAQSSLRPSPLSSLFSLCAGPRGIRPTWPLRPMAHPVPSFFFFRSPEPPPLPVRCRAMRRRVLPSRTRMEMNRSAARPPSPSHTSSAPHRLLSLIQCRNCRVKYPPPADPLPSPPPPPRGYKRPLSHHGTTPQLVPLLVSLLCAFACPHQAPPPNFDPLHRRCNLATVPPDFGLGELRAIALSLPAPPW